jgi:hypothetical protein
MTRNERANLEYRVTDLTEALNAWRARLRRCEIRGINDTDMAEIRQHVRALEHELTVAEIALDEAREHVA